MGVEVAPRMLKSLRDRNPAIDIELSLSDKLADLLAHEVDIAVRAVAPTQAALVARKVAAIPIGLFATATYLEKHGQPEVVADLAHHDLIGPDRDHLGLALAEAILPVEALRRFVFRTDSQPAQLAAARAGLGIAPTQIPVGNRDPALIRVLPDVVVMTLDTWVVTHENLRHVPRIRTVFDSLVRSYSKYGRTGLS